MSKNFWAYRLSSDQDNTITMEVLKHLTNESRNEYSIIMQGEENSLPQAIVLNQYADEVTETLNNLT